MAIFLTRAGKHGEHEQKFLDDGRIYFTWDGLSTDLNKATSLDEYYQVFGEAYPDEGKGTIQNWGRQGRQFCRTIQEGDWVALPSKRNATIHLGKVISPSEFDPSAPTSYKNSRKVDWFAQDIPRTRFDQDILFSLGSAMTIARVKRNNAEARIKEMSQNNWQVPQHSSALLDAGLGEGEEEESTGSVDLETTAYDQISRLILARFKGHGLATLVKAILDSQGYTTFKPPEGPDHGVDIIAAPGNLGFGKPKLCVQVKSGDSPVERDVLDKLVGTMEHVRAEVGLLVSWGGFKRTIVSETAAQFFRVRLWNRDDLITNLLDSYERLDEEIRAKLPLKSIWCVATPDSD